LPASSFPSEPESGILSSTHQIPLIQPANPAASTTSESSVSVEQIPVPSFSSADSTTNASAISASPASTSSDVSRWTPEHIQTAAQTAGLSMSDYFARQLSSLPCIIQTSTSQVT
jgi:hypothetical protein